MPLGDCLRALGLAPESSWDEIRQAYKDLVRVWHPDRFQSDPQLRDRAQQRLQQINDAYLVLKAAHRFNDPGEPPSPPPRPAQKPEPPAPPVRSRPRHSLLGWLVYLPLSWPVKLFAACLMPMLFGGLMLKSLRVPTVDSVLIEGSLPRPAILMPSRLIDPMSGPSTAATTLAAWARGEGANLWRALPKIGDGPSSTPVAVADAVKSIADPPESALALPDVRRHVASAPVAPAMPVNGTEILWTRRSGAGELWITNETGKDALVTLVQTHTTEPLRAVYIQANSKVCVRNIAVGVDDVIAEVGENWDPRAFRFRTGRHSLGRSGPFDFFEVASAQGSSGRRYDAVLKAR